MHFHLRVCSKRTLGGMRCKSGMQKLCFAKGWESELSGMQKLRFLREGVQKQDRASESRGASGLWVQANVKAYN